MGLGDPRVDPHRQAGGPEADGGTRSHGARIGSCGTSALCCAGSATRAQGRADPRHPPHCATASQRLRPFHQGGPEAWAIHAQSMIHDHSGKPAQAAGGHSHFSYGRPFYEIMPALEKITGRSDGWRELRFVASRRRIRATTPPAQALPPARRRWADWWSKNWRKYVRARPSATRSNKEVAGTLFAIAFHSVASAASIGIPLRAERGRRRRHKLPVHTVVRRGPSGRLLGTWTRGGFRIRPRTL